MVYKTLMLPVNVLVSSFLMVVVVSTILALYRTAVAGLIAPLLQIVTDSSRYGTSTRPAAPARGPRVGDSGDAAAALMPLVPD